MNARLGVRRNRWTHLALVSVGPWLLASACAEVEPVNPALVPEASVDVGPPGDANADADVDSSSGGSGGSGGTGGSGGSGGTGATAGGAGSRSDAGDAGDALDEVVAEAGADTSDGARSDASIPDMSVPPEAAPDATSDPITEASPPDSGGRGDAIADVVADRDGGG